MKAQCLVVVFATATAIKVQSGTNASAASAAATVDPATTTTTTTTTTTGTGICADTDDGALDSGDDPCALYGASPWWCNYYDDGDFTSSDMCCVCGGGGSIQATTTTTTITTVPATPVDGGAAATGDPHLQNIHGERFDLMKTGKHVLVNIPRGVRDKDALLRVQANARRLGGQCADMYFQELNVTGSWAEAKKAGGYHYSVSQHDDMAPKWLAFGSQLRKVELKVVHGRTDSGLRYLNVYVKHLGRAGFAVGGLLGEDDHQDVIIPPEGCDKRMSL